MSRRGTSALGILRKRRRLVIVVLAVILGLFLLGYRLLATRRWATADAPRGGAAADLRVRVAAPCDAGRLQVIQGA